MRNLVGVRQHRSAGLQQHLLLGVVRGFRGKIRVAYGRLSGGGVFQRHVEVACRFGQGLVLEMPRLPSSEVTSLIAWSTVLIVSWAPDWLWTLICERLANWDPVTLRPRAAELALLIAIDAVWLALAPIWKTSELSSTLTLP